MKEEYPYICKRKGF